MPLDIKLEHDLEFVGIINIEPNLVSEMKAHNDKFTIAISHSCESGRKVAECIAKISPMEQNMPAKPLYVMPFANFIKSIK